ncbi:Spo0B domain-containing protein [Myceligenerans sp. TRM 65318]|uniref:histidine kinase n=2 Tax=Myceligenerans pegani TaxID=2776917 RepID=A0ABR9MWQ6_9MICO|nr:Spo0B domain-containing protein [Myceligenerans sp. TRM 65318]MBE3018095.1 Spo0B domain-containing protein [Myceligenerans sp. TRM 65318]
MTLRAQLLVLQVVIVLAVVCVTGVVASALQERQLREAYVDQMTGVAQSVAHLPAIRDAFDDEDPSATIQPIAEVIREASGVTYLVVTDDQGVRYSHPNPERIGERVSTDPSVPLSGEVWTGTQTGTLGTSWRVKVPVFGDAADDASPAPVIGTASVGILESELRADLTEDRFWLLAALAGAVVVGVLCAAWVTRLVRRRIYQLEPEDIATLLETRGLTDALRSQSHEFANTLHVISGLLELGRTDDAIAFIERSGHGGLLTASTVAPDVRSPELAALLLVKTITAREHGVTLDVDEASALDAPGGPEASSLHTDVLVVLGNLIDNAVDATGPEGRVRVLVHDDGPVLRLQVDDDGPGVPEQLRHQVFKAGFSTKVTGDGEHGRGIGLALVRRVVDRRGGEVVIGSGGLGGARVTVELPVTSSPGGSEYGGSGPACSGHGRSAAEGSPADVARRATVEVPAGSTAPAGLREAAP